MTVSFDTPSLSKAFLKPSMPTSVAGCLLAKGAFAPEGLVTMWSGWVELWDVGPTLRVMLCTMAEFAMLVCWCYDKKKRLVLPYFDKYPPY